MDGSAWRGASARPCLWVGRWPALTVNRPGWSGRCLAERPACFFKERDIVSAARQHGFSRAAEASSPAVPPSCLQSLVSVSVPSKKAPEGRGRGQGGPPVCWLPGRHLSVFALTTQHTSQNKRRGPGFTHPAGEPEEVSAHGRGPGPAGGRPGGAASPAHGPRMTAPTDTQSRRCTLRTPPSPSFQSRTTLFFMFSSLPRDTSSGSVFRAWYAGWEFPWCSRKGVLTPAWADV